MEPDYGLFSKNREAYDKDQQALGALRHIWRNGGHLPNGEFVELKDTFKVDMQHHELMKDTFSSDHPVLTARVIEEAANEAVEPSEVLTPYLPVINLKRPGSPLTIPSWGAIHASDMSEGSKYPQVSMDLAGEVTATIGKAGVGIRISEEMIRFSEYDLINAHIQAAGRAMKRHKEQKIANALRDKGTVIFDNGNASVASTDGRNAAGQRNGTVTLEDFFRAHQVMTSNGFHPNTLIVHPNAWMIFAVESVARLFGLQRGASWAFDKSEPHRGENLARLSSVPTSFPTDWNIIVSPYLHYTTVGGEWPLTDIIMCDANALGVIVDNNDGLRTTDFRDPNTDMQNVQFSEHYGVGIMNDGKGIGLLKNVSVGRGIDFWENTQHTITSLHTSLTGLISNATVTGQL